MLGFSLSSPAPPPSTAPPPQTVSPVPAPSSPSTPLNPLSLTFSPRLNLHRAPSSPAASFITTPSSPPTPPAPEVRSLPDPKLGAVVTDPAAALLHPREGSMAGEFVGFSTASNLSSDEEERIVPVREVREHSPLARGSRNMVVVHSDSSPPLVPPLSSLHTHTNHGLETHPTDALPGAAAAAAADPAILSRLSTLESSLASIQAQLAALSTSVDFLVRSSAHPIPVPHPVPTPDVRALESRVATLSTSVSHLLQAQLVHPPQQPPLPLTSQQGSPVSLSVGLPPQTLPRSRASWTPGVDGSALLGTAAHSRRETVDWALKPLAPIPTGASSVVSGRTGTGTTGSGTPTRWDAHGLVPDLLRVIAKHGLPPPNKVQSRVLPILLRGQDLIAQAPPTLDRMAAYIVPALNRLLTTPPTTHPTPGPLIVILTATVDQSSQAHRLASALGHPLGIRVGLAAGSSPDEYERSEWARPGAGKHPHVVCGTPQKLYELFAGSGGAAPTLHPGAVGTFVVDEADQVIARRLADYARALVRLFPPPPSSAPSSSGLGLNVGGVGSYFPPQPSLAAQEHTTALFSNTVPQDVIAFAKALGVSDAVRVLVKRGAGAESVIAPAGGGEAASSVGGPGSVVGRQHVGRQPLQQQPMVGALRQYYLYIAVGASISRSDPMTPLSPSAPDWKLESLTDLFDDLGAANAIVYVNGLAELDAVVFRLAAKGFNALPMNAEMSPHSRMSMLAKYRNPNTTGKTTIIVACDVPIKASDVHQVPLVVNFSMPSSVEEYAVRVAPAMSASNARPGVVISIVTAGGGDVEMLRTIEHALKIKMHEVPMALADVMA